jgi:hypothetical protein
MFVFCGLKKFGDDTLLSGYHDNPQFEHKLSENKVYVIRSKHNSSRRTLLTVLKLLLKINEF